MAHGARVLMVYLEPAPYVVGLIEEIRSIWAGQIDVLYVHGALSQPWGYDIRGPAEAQVPAGAVRGLVHIRRALKKNDYKLIHLAGWGDPILLGTLLLGSVLRIPTTVESDTPWTKAQSVSKRLAKMLLYRMIFKLPAFFLPAGRRQAAYLRRYGVEEERIQIAQMTVDVRGILSYGASVRQSEKSSALHRYGIPEGGTVILYLGRLEPHKGVLDLVDAFDRLKTRIESVSLLIVGDGSLAPWVKQQACPARSIYYIGRLSGEKVWEAYTISDVFVLPSHFEPWGLVINEAMASALPVIATDRVGCVDDLVVEETGMVVPAESPLELFQAMEILAKDADLRRRMGSSAKRLIEDWTLENSANRTIGAWHRALQ